jgi:voltage-gated potassium channel
MAGQPSVVRKPREYLSAADTGWRRRLFVVIFEADTRGGQLFDLALLCLIVLSVATVMLDSVEPIHVRWEGSLDALEWFFTLAFTLEYVLRLVCVRHPLRYARSTLGIIDLLAIAPTWLALFFPRAEVLIGVRVLRMLRVFRILKLGPYVSEFSDLRDAVVDSRRKIAAFISFVLVVVVVIGTLMYVVEGPQHGFTSVPASVYWAITTMTTVGFGDITPQTDIGRFIASVIMLIGWGTLAVPTGIVSAEYAARRARAIALTTRNCPRCLSTGHSASAKYCQDCGADLLPYETDAPASTQKPRPLLG